MKFKRGRKIIYHLLSSGLLSVIGWRRPSWIFSSSRIIDPKFTIHCQHYVNKIAIFYTNVISPHRGRVIDHSSSNVRVLISRVGHFHKWDSWWTSRSVGQVFLGVLPFSSALKFIPSFSPYLLIIIRPCDGASDLLSRTHILQTLIKGTSPHFILDSATPDPWKGVIVISGVDRTFSWEGPVFQTMTNK